MHSKLLLNTNYMKIQRYKKTELSEYLVSLTEYLESVVNMMEL